MLTLWANTKSLSLWSPPALGTPLPAASPTKKHSDKLGATFVTKAEEEEEEEEEEEAEEAEEEEEEEEGA